MSSNQDKKLEELISNLQPEDLKSFMSLGFIVKGSLITFSELIGLIKDHLQIKPGEFLVTRMASTDLLQLKPVRRE